MKLTKVVVGGNNPPLANINTSEMRVEPSKNSIAATSALNTQKKGINQIRSQASRLIAKGAVILLSANQLSKCSLLKHDHHHVQFVIHLSIDIDIERVENRQQ